MGSFGTPITKYYGVINKKFGVEEVAVTSLPSAILTAQNLSDKLDVISRVGASEVNAQVEKDDPSGNWQDWGSKEPETSH